MPRVFVHGHPETAAIWGPLLEHLEGPSPVLLSPPGYGIGVPGGFGGTVADYRDWLIGELEDLGEPADLVGHDWGGGHVLNTVMARPDLVGSWVVDVLGVFDEDYVWHEYARRVQAGMDHAFPAEPADREALLERLGMSHEVAAMIAEGQGEEMARAADSLYRSAEQPVMATLGRGLDRAAARPGLSLLATEDTYVGTVEQRLRAAERAGAPTVRLEGLGHWWMVEDPALGARVLGEFWSSLGRA